MGGGMGGMGGGIDPEIRKYYVTTLR
jgi:hypothetical protein